VILKRFRIVEKPDKRYKKNALLVLLRGCVGVFTAKRSRLGFILETVNGSSSALERLSGLLTGWLAGV